MRARWLGVLVLSGVAATAAGADSPFPEPNGRVNDFAKILDAGAKQRVQGLVDALAQDTRVEVYVVTTFHTGDRRADELAQALFAQWSIAKRSHGKGLLLLLVKNVPKLEVHMGAALETVLPDAYDVELLLDSAHTQLRLGRLDQAVIAATRELDTRIRQGRENGGLGSEEPSDTAASADSVEAPEPEIAKIEPATGFQRSLPGFAWALIVAVALAGLWFVVSQRLQEKMPEPLILGIGFGAAFPPVLFAVLGAVSPWALLISLGVAAVTGILALDSWNRQCPQCELWSDPTSNPPDVATATPAGVSTANFECRFCGHRFTRPGLMSTVRRVRLPRKRSEPNKSKFTLTPTKSPEHPAARPHSLSPASRMTRGLRR